MANPDGGNSEVIEALIKEAQIYGDTLIRLQETAVSRPLTASQLDVLCNQEERLRFLGLKLDVSSKGLLHLASSNIVGSARFIHNRSAITIHIQPKIGNSNFLRMLDYVFGGETIDQQPIDADALPAESSGLFLEFFARTVLGFLHRTSYRNYSYSESASPNRVKGRPLLREYITHFVPRAQSHILPCRYLEYSADVLENQIILSAIHRALHLAAFLPQSKKRSYLIGQLQLGVRMMAGVSLKSIQPDDIQRVRYSRLNHRFQPIHQLCQVLLENSSITLQPGEKIPFIAFAVDMAKLFESYVATLFKVTFKESFIGEKTKLTYPIGGYDKQIVLDGLLIHNGRKSVVECKYKMISAEKNDFVIDGGKINSADLYQVVAYASHEQIQADVSFLVYPAWILGTAKVILDTPISSFGWRRQAQADTPIYIVGINLGAPFANIVADLRNKLLPILSLSIS